MMTLPPEAEPLGSVTIDCARITEAGVVHTLFAGVAGEGRLPWQRFDQIVRRQHGRPCSPQKEDPPMRSLRFWLLFVLSLTLLLGLAAACKGEKKEGVTPTPGGLTGELEIFSWWTTGGEAAGLQALFDLYPDKCPGDVKIVNATVAGGAGFQARQVLTTRMLGGDPPGSFQVHMGHELTDTWVTTGNMEPLDSLFDQEGWKDVFPKGVLDIISYKGKPYSVPVNIHRANVLWYNKQVFSANNLQPPANFDDFFRVADALKAKGITPL